MKNIAKILIVLVVFLLGNTSFATKFCHIEYTIPIDYSKIDKNTLESQANLFFDYYSKIQSKDEKRLDEMDLRKFISDKKNEIYEKLKNGDTEVSIPIGAQSFTEEEWEKLLEKVDNITDELREAMREEYRKRLEEAMEEDRKEFKEISEDELQ